MRRQHLSVSLSPVPTRINILRHSEQPLKRDRIYPLHQIETFRLKYCWDINSAVCAKSGIQIRCCIREKYSGSTPERVRLQESSNAVILLCASLACCTFRLNQCVFRFDHGKGCNSVCQFQTT